MQVHLPVKSNLLCCICKHFTSVDTIMNSLFTLILPNNDDSSLKPYNIHLHQQYIPSFAIKCWQLCFLQFCFLVFTDFAKMNMVLFSRFIPNVETSCHLENWPSTPEEYCNFHKEIIQNHEHERYNQPVENSHQLFESPVRSIFSQPT